MVVDGSEAHAGHVRRDIFARGHMTGAAGEATGVAFGVEERFLPLEEGALEVDVARRRRRRELDVVTRATEIRALELIPVEQRRVCAFMGRVLERPGDGPPHYVVRRQFEGVVVGAVDPVDAVAEVAVDALQVIGQLRQVRVRLGPAGPDRHRRVAVHAKVSERAPRLPLAASFHR